MLPGLLLYLVQCDQLLSPAPAPPARPHRPADGEDVGRGSGRGRQPGAQCEGGPCLARLPVAGVAAAARVHRVAALLLVAAVLLGEARVYLALLPHLGVDVGLAVARTDVRVGVGRLQAGLLPGRGGPPQQRGAGRGGGVAAVCSVGVVHSATSRSLHQTRALVVLLDDGGVLAGVLQTTQ